MFSFRKIGLTLGVSLVAATLVVPVGSPAGAAVTAAPLTGNPSVVVPGQSLPFDPPPTEVLRGSPKKVFAHYMTPLPLSLDNQAPASDYYARNYLTPNGEGGKHAAYGGYLRDRPQPRGVRPEADWRLRDLKEEVRHAIATGVDGFSVDLLALGDTGGQLWTNTLLMMQAAQEVDPGFKILLMPDMSGSLRNKDAATIARWVAHLGAHPSAYRLADGRLVVSPFLTEAHDAAWWRGFLDTMRTSYGETVAFVPLFLDERPHLESFAPISYGMSIWGARTPTGNDPLATHPSSPRARIAAVRNKGLHWMQPVSVQDARPREGIYDEAQNTTNLRNTWRIARDSGAEWVQMVTWNDYAEGAVFAPSVKHGWSYLDISAFYLAWYKAGSFPPLVRDAVYLSHRTQPAPTLPSGAQTLIMKLRGGSSPARDTVEALTFLPTAASVRVTVGDTTTVCPATAGADTCTVPLGAGPIRAEVLRGGSTTATVTSPHAVTTAPVVQDLQYVAVSSGREGTTTLPATAPVVLPVPTTPSGLTASVSPATVALAWTASTDDVGVTRYEIHRFPTGWAPGEPTLVGSTSGTSYRDAGVPAGSYNYRIVALDADGHRSPASEEAGARVADSTDPSATEALAAKVNGSTVALSWAPASDDVAVTGYDVHRSGLAGFAPSPATLVESVRATSHVDLARSNGRWFYRVLARDAVGNTGASSAEAMAVVAVVAATPTTTVRLTPVADTYANQGAPTTNFGNSASMVSRGYVGGTSHLRFVIPAAPAGKTLTAASMRLRTTTDSFAGSAESHKIRIASDLWSESTLTWNTRPSILGPTVGTVSPGIGVNTAREVSLNPTAMAPLVGKQSTLALTNAGTDSLWLWTRNHANSGYRPQLTLTYR